MNILIKRLIPFIKRLIPLILAIQTVYSWHCFYYAPQLPYDDNYGLLWEGFFASVLTMLGVIVLITRFKSLFLENLKYILIWVLLGSPIPFLMIFFFHPTVFGEFAV